MLCRLMGWAQWEQGRCTTQDGCTVTHGPKSYLGVQLGSDSGDKTPCSASPPCPTSPSLTPAPCAPPCLEAWLAFQGVSPICPTIWALLGPPFDTCLPQCHAGEDWGCLIMLHLVAPAGRGFPCVAGMLSGAPPTSLPHSPPTTPPVS